MRVAEGVCVVNAVETVRQRSNHKHNIHRCVRNGGAKATSQSFYLLFHSRVYACSATQADKLNDKIENWIIKFIRFHTIDLNTFNLSLIPCIIISILCAARTIRIASEAVLAFTQPNTHIIGRMHSAYRLSTRNCRIHGKFDLCFIW